MTRSRSVTSLIYIFLFLCVMVAMVWGIYHLVEKNDIGKGFVLQWLGFRTLVTEGTSPYSEITSEKIQKNISNEYNYVQWGPLKYNMPLFSGIMILPFTIIGNEIIAHSLWSSFQAVIVMVIIFLCLRITGWRPSWFRLFFFILFTIFSYHVFLPWINGGLAIWSLLFLVLAIDLIQNGRNEASGVFLALSLIQPIMVILPVIFTIIWAATQKRNLLILWFFITLFFLSVISIFLVPDWILQYLRILYNFTENFPPGSPIILLSSIWPGLGKQIGLIISGICSLGLLIEWVLAYRKDFRWYLWSVCLTIVISQWVGIPTVPMHLIGMIFALILIAAMLSERWPRGGQWVAVGISILLFIWEWSLFYSNTYSDNPGMQINLIFPLPFVLLIGLYWVRWWAIKPRGLFIDELKFGER